MSDQEIRPLSRAWDEAVRALGGTSAEDGSLEAAYGGADRSYHDTVHVLQVLRDSAALAGHLPERVRAHVVLAALAHDVVYDGRAGDDERASAAWARARLAASGVPVQDADEVARLVLATADHAVAAQDSPGTALMDADLAVLGSDPASYDAYAAKVRREYAQYDDETWALGRSAVLRDLLSHEQLYRSEAARTRWEAAARANLTRELATYQG
jgi:predicted metal-dependent HD superfamily phosphohydrolase